MRAVCVTVRDPFHPALRREVVPVRKRRRLRAMAPRTNQPHICILNGRPVLRREWGRRLQDGDVLHFVVLPQGGGGGSNPLRVVLMIAVAVFAPYAAGAILGTTAAAAAAAGGMTAFTFAATSAVISLAGGMLINALIPPPKPTQAQLSSDITAASPTYSIGAQGNSARIGQPIPSWYGRNLIYPDFGAMPYTEFLGNEQYLYQLLVIGQGSYDIEQIRIEDTPITSFDEVTTQVVGPGGTVTLFPTRVMTSVEVAGQEITYGAYVGPFVANDSGTLADSIAFDVVLPRGLYYANNSGGLDARSVTFALDVQAINDAGTAIGSWSTLQTVTITARTTTPIRQSYRYAVTAGRYQCRVIRTTAKDTNTRVGNDLVWGGLRAYLPGSQSYGAITLIAMRIRATDNISSQASRRINVIATRRLRTWTGSAWTGEIATRNPAWALADIAQAQYGGRMPDARIDRAGLLAFANVAASRGDEFNFGFDSASTVWEAATVCARSSRAVVYQQGGMLRAFRDAPADFPVAMFSPRNMTRNSLSLQYKMASEDTADAVDMEFFNRDTWGWETTRAALAGSSQSSVYKFRIPGVTSRAQAWREGMYMAACNRYRRRFATFVTEMEGFIPSIGDCIAITHDMPRWGQFAEAVAWDVGTQYLTLSEPMDWSAGGSHYAALRARDGSRLGSFLCAETSNPNIIRLVNWSASTDDSPDVGQDRERTHVAFGPADAQYAKARVLAVRPRSLSSVEIEAVIESDFVHTADTGVAPGGTAWQLPTRNTAPAISGLIARSVPGDVTQMIVSWAPSAWADHYIIEQSADGINWTRVGETTTNSYTCRALYESATIVRVAAVGMTRGPWVSVAYALGADYMWSDTASTLMWDADSNAYMWS